MSIMLVWVQGNTGGVWYICKGNTLTDGNNRPFQGSIFTVPSGEGGRELSTVGWLFPSPSERRRMRANTVDTMNVSVHVSKHAHVCLCVVFLTICSRLPPFTSVLATIVACLTGMIKVCQGSSDTSQIYIIWVPQTSALLYGRSQYLWPAQFSFLLRKLYSSNVIPFSIAKFCGFLKKIISVNKTVCENTATLKFVISNQCIISPIRSNYIDKKKIIYSGNWVIMDIHI